MKELKTESEIMDFIGLVDVKCMFGIPFFQRRRYKKILKMYGKYYLDVETNLKNGFNIENVKMRFTWINTLFKFKAFNNIEKEFLKKPLNVSCYISRTYYRASKEILKDLTKEEIINIEMFLITEAGAYHNYNEIEEIIENFKNAMKVSQNPNFGSDDELLLVMHETI